jgi:hypothetical protein
VEGYVMKLSNDAIVKIAMIVAEDTGMNIVEATKYAERINKYTRRWNNKAKCEICGGEVIARNKNVKYCSAACRTAAYREREKT